MEVKCTCVNGFTIMGDKQIKRKQELKDLYSKESLSPLLYNWIEVSKTIGAMYSIFGETIIGIKPEHTPDALLSTSIKIEPWELTSTYHDLQAAIYLSPCDQYIALVFTKRKELWVLSTKDMLYKEGLDINYSFNYDEYGYIVCIEWMPKEQDMPTLLVVLSNGALILKKVKGEDTFKNGLGVEYATYLKRPLQIAGLVKNENKILILNAYTLEEVMKLSINTPLSWIKETDLGITLLGATQHSEEIVYVISELLVNWVHTGKIDLHFTITNTSEDTKANGMIMAELPKEMGYFIGCAKSDELVYLYKDKEWKVMSLRIDGGLIRGVASYVFKDNGEVCIIVCDSEGDIRVFSFELSNTASNNRFENPFLARTVSFGEIKPPLASIEEEKEISVEMSPQVQPKVNKDIERVINNLISTVEEEISDYKRTAKEVLLYKEQQCLDINVLNVNVNEHYNKAKEWQEQIRKLQIMQENFRDLLNMIKIEMDVFFSYQVKSWRKRYERHHLVDRSTLIDYNKLSNKYKELSKELYKLSVQKSYSCEFNDSILAATESMKSII